MYPSFAISLEHEVAPLGGVLGVAERVVAPTAPAAARRGARPAGASASAAWWLKYVERGGLHPEGVVAVEDAVEVPLQDRPAWSSASRSPWRGTASVELDGQAPRASFGWQRFFISCIVRVEPPWRAAVAADVADRGADDAVVVDAVVRVELLVLDRDRRVEEDAAASGPSGWRPGCSRRRSCAERARCLRS